MQRLLNPSSQVWQIWQILPILPLSDFLHNLINQFIPLFTRIHRYTQRRTLKTLLALIAMQMVYRPRAMRSDLLLQPRFARREKEGGAGGDTDDAVEVDACPGCGAGGDGEENEGCGDEGEGKLGHEPCKDVVVTFVGAWFGAVGCHEKGSKEAA